MAALRGGFWLVFCYAYAMNASAKLYGICREIGYCVEDCGLCEKIANPGTRPAHRESTVFELPELEADEIEQNAPRRRGQTQCMVCGKNKRINHNCKGEQAFVVKKLPKATPVTWDDVKLKMCDWCRRKLGGHYAWCQEQ